MVQGLRGTVRQPVSSRNRARLPRRGVTNVLRDGGGGCSGGSSDGCAVGGGG